MRILVYVSQCKMPVPFDIGLKARQENVCVE